MRKTRNFLRRAGSAALALTLTVSLCQPAFAATKAPFSKDETVYAVMAADGSVTKTTVSEHLYNADGLAGVEDRSTLKNIVNTESFAEYTQNGDTLVWNTDDTDVYYKGETDRQLPISARVTYTLDGRTAPLSELLGKSGHLVLTIDLTNHETGKVTVNGKERTIVTPLVTAVGVVLGDDASNVNAVNGLLESAAKSSVAAFVTLPGVKESLDGLLPEQVNGVAEYLQDSVTVEADVESLTAPQILLACAASAEALGQGDEVLRCCQCPGRQKAADRGRQVRQRRRSAAQKFRSFSHSIHLGAGASRRRGRFIVRQAGGQHQVITIPDERTRAYSFQHCDLIAV